jgi:hypothetical protein
MFNFTGTGQAVKAGSSDAASLQSHLSAATDWTFAPGAAFEIRTLSCLNALRKEE